jgi:hypothetical protein
MTGLRSALAPRLLALGAMLPLAGCGDGATQKAASRAAARPAAAAELYQSCAFSWTPGHRTFRPGWRRDSIRIGAVTFLYLRRYARHTQVGDGVRKISILVEPRREVRISFGRRAGVGFVRAGPDGKPLTAPVPSLRLEGCQAIPREARVREAGPRVGYPVVILVTRDGCMPVTVRDTLGSSAEAVISLGGGRCARD